MATGASVQRRVGALLKRLNATARQVSLRRVTSSGGNALLGIGGTSTVTDTVCDPQPDVSLLTADVIANSGGLYQVGDYSITFSGDTLESDLRNSLVVYGDDVLKIVKIDSSVLNGIVCVWRVTARSIRAGTQ